MKISIKQYSQTLFDLTNGKSEQEILNVVKKFAEQLKKDGQLKNAKAIIEKFSALYNGANGIVEAEVKSARKLEAAQIVEIEKFVRDKYSAKEVKVENIIDEKVKGGIIIRVGDEVIDGSVEAQLNKLKKELKR